MNSDHEIEEQQFTSIVKSLERQKFWFPVALIGALTVGIWRQTGELIRQPASVEETYLLVIGLGVLFALNELTNVRIMLVNAQRREWRRAAYGRKD